MLTKKIKYTDYDGNVREEPFYFNISKAEFAELDLSITGGFEAMIQTLIDKKDIPGMMRVFKDLIVKSYGVKSADGRRMMKSEELTKDFLETEAYSELFMELCSDANTAIEFVKGIMPVDEDKKAEVDKAIAEVIDINGGAPVRV